MAGARDGPPPKARPMTSKASIPRFLFDQRDHQLIRIVNDVLRRTKFTRKLYFPYFHPNGIKEMAETKGLRTAYAVAHLLSSLEAGGMDERINALRSLRQEVIETAKGPMPKNTARVLLQIMKDLVRSHGDTVRQLELAHEFRRTASGKPRIVRGHLKRYHLLEMPEEWNQVAFDDHVHDANTKGRKSSTHLIMDAWIKGIRRLGIIHYNYVEPRFAAELLEAARVMDIDVRIGIEFSARFHDKYVQLIWAPRGFTDAQSFLCFLAEPTVMKIMAAGREVSRYQQRYVLALLERVNEVHLRHLGTELGVTLPAVDLAEFLKFVGIGQKSRHHLSKFIQDKVLKALKARLTELRAELPGASPERQAEIRAWVEAADGADLEAMIDAYLEPSRNPQILYPDHPVEAPDVPELLRLGPAEILARLAALHAGYRVTLNLTDLTVAEVLELLYDCQGMITHLEIFNLKDYAGGKTANIGAISRLMQAINEGSPIRLKQVIQEIVTRLKQGAGPENAAQVAKLTAILHDIDSLRASYAGKPIKVRIGSDSTGRSPRLHGMGLAAQETLPPRAQRQIREDCRRGVREAIPVRMAVTRNLTLPPTKGASRFGLALQALTAAFSLGGARESWALAETGIRMADPGNIMTLGGVQKHIVKDLQLEPPKAAHRRAAFRWRFLGTGLQNVLKVIIGFIPAFATFALTKDWWFLAWFGAFIWFGITGLRNILQSVLGGGGFRRSPLLQWNDYVSWSRTTDSLMFTGFSVPLLDYVVKTLVLDRGFGITTTTHPVLLYMFMALANGIYLSSHNLFRGLPKTAVYGNFFRSVVSIPIAVAINTIAGGVLTSAGVAGVNDVLQKWAAIISKTASDFVAGFIEGTADRQRNIRTRLREYKGKFEQLFDIYAKLELLYPEAQASEILRNSENFERKGNLEARDLEKIIMIHALDLLYFWMYQPRARTALGRFVATLTEEERHILASSQFTLLRTREISQMFIDGIVGDNFPRPLSFYLSRHAEYLEAIKGLVFEAPPADPAANPMPLENADHPGALPRRECANPDSHQTAN
jgi:hypothetical protein